MALLNHAGEPCAHPAGKKSNWGDGVYGCGECGATPQQLQWQAFLAGRDSSGEVVHKFEAPSGAIMHHNSDFSGDVLIPLDSGDVVRITFADMAALVAEAVRRKKVEFAERSTIEEVLGMPMSPYGLIEVQGRDADKPSLSE